MEQFKLVKPEDMERNMIAAFFNELSHDQAEMHGCLNLKRFSTNGGASYDLEAWVKAVQKARNLPNTDEGVPTEALFLVREYTTPYGARNVLPSQQIVGMISIRQALNYNLFNSSGHIVFSLVKLRHRLKIEEVALYLALNLLHKRGIEVTLMTPEISGVSVEACKALGVHWLYRGFDDVHERDIDHYILLTDTEEYDSTYEELVLEYPQ